MSSSRKYSRKGFKGFPSHYHSFTHGIFFEPLKVIRNMPKKFIISTYNIIITNSNTY